MNYLKSILFCIVCLVICTGSANTYAQTTATKEQVEEIQKILDKIKELKKAGKGDGDPDVVKLAEEAITKTDKYYKIPDDNLKDKKEPKYDPNYGGDGKARKSGKKVEVTLGPPAFSSPGWLASTKSHEIETHGDQAATDRWYNSAKGDNINEVEAYDGELRDSTKHGLSADEIAELKKRRKGYYDKLDSANKAKLDKQKEEGKDYTIAMITPRGTDMVALVRKTELFVAGNVLSEERMTVSVRGTQRVEGIVVKTEVNGKQTETQTDSKGKAIIDFSALAAGLTAPAVAIIRSFDSKGNEIASATTNIQPGNPMIFDRPEIGQLPTNLPSGNVVTIPGQNLGADAQLVCGEQVQETLSASDKELTVFTDSKTGEQPLYVVTPNGVSESQTVNVYSLNFVLPKSTISPKEVVNAQVRYASLPVGTKLIFTNNSPSTVKMVIPGGSNVANECIYTITQPNGTIPVNITGIVKGGFSINLDTNFIEGGKK